MIDPLVKNVQPRVSGSILIILTLIFTQWLVISLTIEECPSMKITREIRNVSLLSFCQALGQTQMILVFSVSSIIGASIAPSVAWATVPITFQFVFMTLSTVPAAFLMKRIGRANGFTVFLLVGCGGAMLMVYALYVKSFALFCLVRLCSGLLPAPINSSGLLLWMLPAKDFGPRR